MSADNLRGIAAIAAIGLAVWAFYGRDDDPKAVATSRARDALELHYLDADIYSPVRCTIAEGEKPAMSWVLCRGVPLNGATGGLYMTDTDDTGEPRIWAVNGRAIQHIGGRDNRISLHDVDGRLIPAEAWKGAPMDIHGALSLF